MGCAFVCSALLATVAHGQSAKAPAVARELQVVHQLGAERHQALLELATRFNQGRSDFVVTVREGELPGGNLPHMIITDDEGAEQLLGDKPGIKPLHAAMREAGVPLRTIKPPAVIPRHAVDAQGRLMALPVGLSTPVLYVNRDALREAGLDPDMPMQTWPALQQVLGRLYEAGSACPYTVSEPGRVMIENASAWHNEPVTRKEGRNELPRFNGMLQIKHVALMASWHRSRYLHLFDRPAEAEARFATGECATIAAPSSSWVQFRSKGRFDLGILSLPYHDDMPGAPQNTLADGPMLWVAAGKQAAEYKAVARFVDFWLQPENQVAWQRESGYLPLSRSGFLAAYSEVLGADLENVQVAVSQLTNKPPTAASSASILTGQGRSIRLVDRALEEVWAERKPTKQALDDAVALMQTPEPKTR